jgi:predicted Zn-dependent protease
VAERIGYLKDRIKQMPKAVRDRTDDDTVFYASRPSSGPVTTIGIGHGRLPGQGRQDDLPGQLGLAVAMGRTHAIAGARAACGQALACGGDDARFLREAGRFEAKARNFDQAENDLRRSMDKNPDDLTTLFEYARLLAQSGRVAQALPLMNRVRMNFPENADIYTTYGQMLGQAGELFEAHLHLAYAAVFESNERQAKFQMDKAKALARSDEQKREFARLEELFKKRSEFWKKRIL